MVLCSILWASTVRLGFCCGGGGFAAKKKNFNFFLGFVGVFWYGFLVGCGGFEFRERERERERESQRGACEEASLREEKLTNGVNGV